MTNTVSRIISDDTLSRIIQIESAGNPNAKAKTSSATGLGQFIDGTWIAVVQKHRPDLLKGRSRAEVLALRKDPSLAVELLARFTEDNAAALGKGYGDGDLYLAHFAGVGTARKILQTFPATSVSKIVSAQAISANPSILRGKTCAQVREWATKKMAAAGGRDWVAKWYRGKPAAEPQGTIAKQAAGGTAVAGFTMAAGTAAHEGLGVGAWLAIVGGVLLLIGLTYFVWRWWKQRRARKQEGEAAPISINAARALRGLPPITAETLAATKFTITAPQPKRILFRSDIGSDGYVTGVATKRTKKRPAAKRPAKRKAKRKAA